MAAPPATSSARPSNGLDASAAAAAPVEDPPELPQMILIMRLANMLTSMGVIVYSIFFLIRIPAVSQFVLAIYGTCGGLLICCLETQLKFLRVIIAVNFGFLFHSGWRFLFYVLLATVLFSYDKLVAEIIAYAVMGCAIFNTYILIRYPSYRKVRDKIAEEEDKRVEARIAKEVKSAAVRQAFK